jgi:hypothetical protein
MPIDASSITISSARFRHEISIVGMQRISAALEQFQDVIVKDISVSVIVEPNSDYVVSAHALALNTAAFGAGDAWLTALNDPRAITASGTSEESRKKRFSFDLSGQQLDLKDYSRLEHPVTVFFCHDAGITTAAPHATVAKATVFVNYEATGVGNFFPVIR